MVVPHAALQCRLSEGAGGYLRVVLTVGGLASEGAPDVSYGVPIITAVGGGEHNTSGGSPVQLRGLNMGPAGGAALAEMESTREAEPSTGAPLRHFVECAVTVAHVRVDCAAPEGWGTGFRWRVTVDGRRSNWTDVTTDYGPPTITGVTSWATGTDLGTAGGDVFVINGTNLGGDGVANVTFGGWPIPAADVYYASHGRLVLFTLPGAGTNVTAVTLGLRTASSPFTYGPPAIVVQEYVRNDGESPVFRATGRNFGQCCCLAAPSAACGAEPNAGCARAVCGPSSCLRVNVTGAGGGGGGGVLVGPSLLTDTKFELTSPQTKVSVFTLLVDGVDGNASAPSSLSFDVDQLRTDNPTLAVKTVTGLPFVNNGSGVLQLAGSYLEEYGYVKFTAGGSSVVCPLPFGAPVKQTGSAGEPVPMVFGQLLQSVRPALKIRTPGGVDRLVNASDFANASLADLVLLDPAADVFVRPPLPLACYVRQWDWTSRQEDGKTIVSSTVTLVPPPGQGAAQLAVVCGRTGNNATITAQWRKSGPCAQLSR